MKRLMIPSFVAMVMTGCASAGGGTPIDLSKLPPIVISVPTPTDAPAKEQAPPAKAQATLAFHVQNLTGTELNGAIATVKKDGVKIDAKQAVEQGYIAFVLDLLDKSEFYEVTFELEDYKTITRKFAHAENHQWEIILSREHEDIVPNPLPSIPPVAAPPATPPVVTPQPVVMTPLEESAGWSDEQWRAFVIPLLKKTGDLVNEGNLKFVRAELVARGADFQNGWRGDMRARVFLPVHGCPSSAIKPDPLPCAYNRTFDLGLVGEQWQWIKR